MVWMTLAAVHRVLQLDAEHALSGVLDQVEFLDVAFVLEDAGDAGADLAVGHHDHAPADPVGISDACEHVRDGILIVHLFSSPALPACLFSVRG